MRNVGKVIIGFLHDFAAGVWAATVLGVWWLERAVVDATSRTVLDGLERELFWIGLVAVTLVFATGAGRTFTYVDNFYGPEAELARRRALIVKHLVLFTVFGGGIWWQWTMAFR